MTALECEAALVAAATRGGPLPRDPAALSAVASRYLAVGTPRSFAIIGDGPGAAATLAAHRTWFQPRDVRATIAELGHAVSIDEALAADIVCIHAPTHIAATQLRRGTHVNICVPDAASYAFARVVRIPDLAQIAAGFVDGRQLDEITVFIAA